MDTYTYMCRDIKISEKRALDICNWIWSCQLGTGWYLTSMGFTTHGLYVLLLNIKNFTECNHKIRPHCDHYGSREKISPL